MTAFDYANSCFLFPPFSPSNLYPEMVMSAVLFCCDRMSITLRKVTWPKAHRFLHSEHEDQFRAEMYLRATGKFWSFLLAFALCLLTLHAIDLAANRPSQSESLSMLEQSSVFRWRSIFALTVCLFAFLICVTVRSTKIVNATVFLLYVFLAVWISLTQALSQSKTHYLTNSAVVLCFYFTSVHFCPLPFSDTVCYFSIGTTVTIVTETIVSLVLNETNLVWHLLQTVAVVVISATALLKLLWDRELRSRFSFSKKVEANFLKEEENETSDQVQEDQIDFDTSYEKSIRFLKRIGENSGN